MTAASARESQAPAKDLAERPGFPNDVKEQVAAYLMKLGVKDRTLLDTVTADCLRRAQSLSAPGAHHELLRRSLEAAQRRFDNTLTSALKISPSALAAARAALLLTPDGPGLDKLMGELQNMTGDVRSILQALPLATPTESHLAMEEQAISFFFTATSGPRE